MGLIFQFLSCLFAMALIFHLEIICNVLCPMLRGSLLHMVFQSFYHNKNRSLCHSSVFPELPMFPVEMFEGLLDLFVGWLAWFSVVCSLSLFLTCSCVPTSRDFPFRICNNKWYMISFNKGTWCLGMFFWSLVGWLIFCWEFVLVSEFSLMPKLLCLRRKQQSLHWIPARDW